MTQEELENIVIVASLLLTLIFSSFLFGSYDGPETRDYISDSTIYINQDGGQKTIYITNRWDNSVDITVDEVTTVDSQDISVHEEQLGVKIHDTHLEPNETTELKISYGSNQNNWKNPSMLKSGFTAMPGFVPLPPPRLDAHADIYLGFNHSSGNFEKTVKVNIEK